MRTGLEGPAPLRDPHLLCPWQKEATTNSRSTTSEVIHITARWEKLRPERDREPPPCLKDLWGSGFLAQGSLLPEAPTEPLQRAGFSVRLQPVLKKTFLLGIPVPRDKRRGPGGLRKGGWADELSEGRRVWSQPATSREPKPPDFPAASTRALQTRGTSRKPWKRRGQAFWPCWKPASFFSLHSSHLRNVPKLGAGNPGL